MLQPAAPPLSSSLLWVASILVLLPASTTKYVVPAFSAMPLPDAVNCAVVKEPVRVGFVSVPRLVPVRDPSRIVAEKLPLVRLATRSTRFST